MSPVVDVIVSAALALGPAPRLPERFEDIEAHVRELTEQKRYQQLAVAARAAFERKDLAPHEHRRMGFFAIRGLHGVFDETGEVARLCDAQRLLRRIVREGVQDDAFTVARLKKATAKYLARSGAESPCSKARPARSAPLVAAASPPAPEPPPAPLLTATSEDDDLIAVGGGATPTEHDSKDMSHKRDESSAAPGATASTRAEAPPGAAEGPPPAPRSPGHDERRKIPRLTAGGIALLSIGVAAGAAFGVSLYYRGRASDTLDALAAAGRQRGASTEEEYARGRRLNASHQELTVAAGLTGSIAAAAVLGSVIMFALKSRRTTTAAAPWAGPTGAGITLRGYF